jgi:hypothetical protein
MTLFEATHNKLNTNLRPSDFSSLNQILSGVHLCLFDRYNGVLVLNRRVLLCYVLYT